MKEIYQKIIEKLFSQEAIDLFSEYNVLPVRYVDLYRGQYLNYENFDVVALPAVLIDWSADLTDVTRNESIITISLHLIYEQVYDTSNLTTNQENALKFFDFIDIVHTLVSNIQGNGIGKLKLRRQEPAELDHPGIVHIMHYEASYYAMEEDVKETFEYSNEGEGDLNMHGKLVKQKNWGDNDYGLDI
jgi:hypothetical protein